ncbi:MAG: DUF2157 domain-containing protein [Candidatus Pacearchaeota archaeon]|jgi:uncharacterized membrane protein
MNDSEKSKFSFVGVVVTFGAILIGLGFAWLIAMNWEWMPDFVKILILVFCTLASYVSGFFLREKFLKSGESLIFLGGLLYTLSVFLIAQIFNIGKTPTQITSLTLVIFIGLILAAIFLISRGNYILAAISFILLGSQIFSSWCSLPKFITIPFLIFLVIGIYFVGVIRKYKPEFGGETFVFMSNLFLISVFILFFSSFLALLIPSCNIYNNYGNSYLGLFGLSMFSSIFSMIPILLVIYFIFRKKLKNQKGDLFFFIGALFLSISLFLICKTLGLEMNLQNISWIFLISLIIFFITAYVFSSKSTLFLAMTYSFIWVSTQFLAFYNLINSSNLSLGILLFYYLSLAILFYSFSLIHKNSENGFGNVYKIWTAFYILLFGYALSFLDFSLFIWAKGVESSIGAYILLALLIIVSLSAFIFSLFKLDGNKNLKKEVLGFILIILLLVIIVSSAGLANYSSGNSDKGYCSLQSCSIYKNINECSSAPEKLNCFWYNNVYSNGYINDKGICSSAACYYGKNETDCLKLSKFGCSWNESSTYNRCNTPPCYDYRNKEECNSINGCGWNNNTLLCRSNLDNSFDDSYHECSKYNNNYEGCKQASYCKWTSDTFSFYFHKSNEAPISLLLYWIFANIIFIIIILAIIGFGNLESSKGIINMGILFFSLEIISRYIGFIMDYWGTNYNSIAILSIVGGVLLIGGGLGIEMWRRKLIKNIK